MKRILLAFTFAAGVIGTAQAQSASFGVKAGASLTNFTGKSADGAKNKFGFNGGFIEVVG